LRAQSSSSPTSLRDPMPLRFYRRIRIAPGLRINLSRSGVSTSMGRRGAWFTIGPRGTRETIGVPGTGISYTEQQRAAPPGRADEPTPGSSRVWQWVVVLALIAASVIAFLR
jgi:Protein of unknown function (DUF4236)